MTQQSGACVSQQGPHFMVGVLKMLLSEENIKHFVQIDGFSSPLLPVKSGVPQGSVLGPLLFLIFINDIPDHISSSALFLFADDSKLQHIVSSESDIQHLQADINSLVSWSKSNSLFLNSRRWPTSVNHTTS